MNRYLSFGLVAVMAVFGATGCAAQAQCMRDNGNLRAQVEQDQRDLRDLNGRLTIVSAEHAGDSFSQLASESWTAAVAAFGWVSNEAPIAARQANAAYDSAAARLERARKCYQDNGGSASHSYAEYQAIASKCLNDN